MKRMSLIAFTLLLLVGCHVADPITRTESPTQPGTGYISFSPITPTGTPAQSSPPAATPSPVVVNIVDGSNIIDPNYLYELGGDESLLYYDPDRAVLPGEDPEKQTVEEEAIALCDRFYAAVADTITTGEEVDVSSLYDLSTPTRLMDWTFNQAYLYLESITKGQDIDATYDGSTYFFNWDQWNVDADNGVLVVFTKTGYTHAYRGSDVATAYGGTDYKTITNEFALTRIDGALKIVRHRNYDFNYVGMQQRAIENPHLLDDLDAFRAYLDDMMDKQRP